MSASCCEQTVDPHRGDAKYRCVLWAVLAINVVMFTIEVAARLAAGSASLQADALDFLGDAGDYAGPMPARLSVSVHSGLETRQHSGRKHNEQS
jgi:hypothetical protein